MVLAGCWLAALTFGGYLALLYLRRPESAPPPSIRVPMTPQRVARGKHLFENLCHCDGCHSQRDFTRFGGPVVLSWRGGGFVFPDEMDLPGRIVASNLTPDKETGLGRWTDGEKIRAIREGVGRDGRALHPLMPYPSYARMSDEDVAALVAYMNTLPPVRHALPRTRIAFPASLYLKSIPRPVGTVPPPESRNQLRLGEYLVTIAACADCHTPLESGQPVVARRLAGGREFRFPGAVVVSAHITPDPESGIGRWSEQQFLEKFYQYREYAEQGSPEVGPESFTLMPWLGLSQLAPQELGAMYAYLMTQPAVRNAVETHPGQPRKPS